ncbi:MAG: hypothetical protein LIR46_12855 [Bacteroidota bacterium]|nr:hypothetical protein [Bacteroidota bacterium]
MARNEEEYYDEEEFEEEEEEDLDITLMLKRNIKMLNEEKKKYPIFSQEYNILDQRILDATEQLRNIETAESENAQKECAQRNKNAMLWQTLGNVFGNVAGTTIGAMFNRSNVKTVVNYENEGGIVNSKAIKYTK